MTSPRRQGVLSGYRGKTVLVTGASGFLGNSLVAVLSAAECRIVRLSRSTRPAPLDSTANVENVCGNVADPGAWRRVIDGVDVVFHLAAQTSVYDAAEDPIGDLRTNVEGTLLLLETVRRARSAATVVFAGTVTQAGLTDGTPVDETVPDRPITVYDLSKLTAENYVKLYARLGWTRGTSLRLANVYGPGPVVGRSDRGVLNKVIRHALGGEPVFVYGSGDYIRDYLYIDDAVSALLLAGLNPETVAGRHFVIGSGTGVTLKDAFALAVERVAAKTGRRVPLEHMDVPDRLSPIEFRNFVAEPNAFGRATGWRPKHSLREGIDRTIEAFCSTTPGLDSGGL